MAARADQPAASVTGAETVNAVVADQRELDVDRARQRDARDSNNSPTSDDSLGTLIKRYCVPDVSDGRGSDSRYKSIDFVEVEHGTIPERAHAGSCQHAKCPRTIW